MAKTQEKFKDLLSKRIPDTKKSRQRKYTLTLFSMGLPGLICLFFFNYLPMFGIVIAFKDYKPLKGIWGSEWCGLKNFEFFFTSQDMVRTISNTVLYSIAFIILDLILGILIAVLLYNLRSRRGVKVYHTIMLLPYFLSMVVISFVAYAILSPSYGLLNQILNLFGIEDISWYAQPSYWPAILIIVKCWTTLGSGCLYYYAALMGVPPELFEAAELDGANSLQKAWHVMVPAMVPVMVMMTILGIGNLFSGDIGLFYNIPKNQGILYSTTDIINTYTYRALLTGDFAKSAAVGLFQSAVGLVLVVGTNAIVRKVSPDNAMF